MNERVSALLRGSAEFGDFRAEYDAFESSCVIVSRADRSAVRVTGERAAEMLNGLITNRVTNLEGRGCSALLLNAKGRVLTDMGVFPQGAAGLLLDVPRTGLDNLLATFKKYLPPIYARYENLSDEVVRVGIYGPDSAAAVSAAMGAAPAEEHLSVLDLAHEGADLLLVRDRRLAQDGIELTLPVAIAPAVAGELAGAVAARGGRAAGWRALEVRRIERGIPLYGSDMSDSNLAQETGLEEAISYDKGCYLGQEVVARVHFRGHVNRRLMGLRFDREPAAPGAHLLRGEKRVGEITSSVDSPAFGPIGLGYVRREIEASARLRWSDGERDGEALVQALPFRAMSV